MIPLPAGWTPALFDVYVRRVLCGIRLMDDRVPDWRDRIDADDLDMENCYRCVFGHVFGQYVIGLERLGLHNGGVDYGLVPDRDDAEPVLRALWVRAVKRLPLGLMSEGVIQ